MWCFFQDHFFTFDTQVCKLSHCEHTSPPIGVKAFTLKYRKQPNFSPSTDFLGDPKPGVSVISKESKSYFLIGVIGEQYYILFMNFPGLVCCFLP